MKRQSLMVLAVTAVLCLTGTVLAEDYGGGSGSAGDPYLISDPCHMQAIGAHPNDWDKHFLLTDDIDLSAYTGTSFNIIGNFSTAFTGAFDGNGHTISNFTYQSPGTSIRIGLFGFVDGGGQIKDFGLIQADVNAPECGHIGALVGGMHGGSISGCYVEGGSVSGGGYVGGLIGYFSYSSISTCYSNSSVTGTQSYVGGLVGNLVRGTIQYCYAVGDVSGGDYYVGGLVGSNEDSIISYCYAASSVTGTGNYIGGLVGFKMISTAHFFCFWDIETSGQTESAGGEGKTTQEIRTESTFTNAGWDFVDEIANGSRDIWKMGANGPRLFYEEDVITVYDSNATIADGNTYDTVVVKGDDTVVGLNDANIVLVIVMDKASFSVAGGRVINKVECYDSSLVTLSEGTIWQVKAYGQSRVNISGGTVDNIRPGFNSMINLSGGTVDKIGLSESLAEDCEINVIGHDLNKVPYGGSYGNGQISGYWNDDSSFIIDLQYGGAYSNIVLYDGVIPPACANRPSSDLNKDCKVDFRDFSKLSSEWLNDGIQ